MSALTLVDFLKAQRASLDELLSSLQKNESADKVPELTLVLGNEACDLDSQISALLWAYYKQSRINSKSSLFIPLLGIPQKELKLRKESLHLYEQIDKSLTQHLFYMDTVPLHKLVSFAESASSSVSNGDNADEKQAAACSSNFKLNVHLVDHNILSIALHPVLGKYVNYIIDHHKEEGEYLATCNNENGKHDRNIAVCGSNVSLLVTHIQQIDAEYDISALAKVFGALINAVILLDTGAFNKDLGKTTETDTTVFELFKQFNLNQDAKQWYEQLLALRTNVDGFGLEEFLLKDLKIFKEREIVFGIPGFGVPFQRILEQEKENVFQVLYQFQMDKQLHIIPAMTIFSEEDGANQGALQRQLALFSDQEALFNHVSNALQTNQNKALLQLQPLNIEPYKHRDAFLLKSNNKQIYYQWWKLGVGISRKKLLPVLRQILKTLKL